MLLHRANGTELRRLRRAGERVCHAGCGERGVIGYRSDAAEQQPVLQLKQLLRDCFDGDPDDHAITVLMEKAGSTVDTTGDGVADTRGVPREALSVAIAKYHSYLKEKTLIDKIFDEFDKDKASARARRPRQ